MPFDGGRRDPERLGRFLDRQTAEEPQLDEPGLLGIDGGQPGERRVDRQQINGSLLTGDEPLVQRDPRVVTAPLLRAPRAGPLDEDLPHRDRGNGDETRTCLPILLLVLDETEIGLVDERRGLQRLARPLTSQVAPGQPP